MKRRSLALALFLLTILTLPAAALADLQFRGWGLRGGFGDDPDQGIVGAHWDLGTLTRNLRFMPNTELGFGDDRTVASLALPLHYVFPVSGSVAPYAGGGALLAYIDRDKPGSNSDFEIDILLAFGLDWTLKSNNKLFVELDMAGGDAHDFKIVLGYTWMRR